MKNLKKNLVVLLMVALVVFLSACQQKAPAQTDNSQNAQQTEQTQNDGLITEQAAKQIVLDKLPGSTEADFYAFNKELDDGIWKYEGKITNNGTIFEFEINAADGTILEWDIDDQYFTEK